MICKWGMSDVIGPQAMIVDDSGFLDGASERMEMSDETSVIIDKEIRKLLGDAYKEALKILGQEYYLLKQLAAILLEVETLDDEEFEIVMHHPFTDKIAAGIKATHNCQNCVASATCIHSKLKA